MENQQSGLTTFRPRVLRDELLRQVVIKIRKIHLFFQKNPHQNGDQNAQQQAGGQGKVNGKSPPLDINVAGELPQVRKLAQDHDKCSHQGEYKAQQEKKSADEANVHLFWGDKSPKREYHLVSPRSQQQSLLDLGEHHRNEKKLQ